MIVKWRIRIGKEGSKKGTEEAKLSQQPHSAVLEREKECSTWEAPSGSDDSRRKKTKLRQIL